MLIFIVFCHCELKTNFICHKCQGWRLSVLYFLIYFVSFALQLRPSILIIYWLLGKYHRNNQVTKVAWLYIKTNLILTWNFLLFFNYIKSINGWIVLQFCPWRYKQFWLRKISYAWSLEFFNKPHIKWGFKIQ